MTTTRTRRTCRVVLALATALLCATTLAGCLRVPTHGPVHAAGKGFAPPEDTGFAYTPRPPRPGASPSEIVNGFLEAMQATPLSTKVAKEYLGRDFAGTWDPSQRTIIYAGLQSPRGVQNVTLPMVEPAWLDAGGSWRGRLTGLHSDLRLTLAREDGEWRIVDAPDALVVPESWFESRFTRLSVYFFDRSGRFLSPEPVYVPKGTQTATALVRSLLRGPGERLRRVLRSFLPTRSDALSVPVQDGVAEIDLARGTGRASSETAELMAAQLAWTLRQDPSIDQIRLSVDGRPVLVSGDEPVFGVSFGSSYVHPGSSDRSLVAVRGGRLWRRPSETGDFAELGGAWASAPDVRTVAVAPDGRSVAAVSAGGGTVWTGPVSRGRVAATALRGTDLLRPAWDALGRLWALDRAPGGARISYLPEAGARPRDVRVPGISGRDVRRFLVSPDGTRLVALLHGRSGDRVVVSRLEATASGRVTGGLPAITLPYDGGTSTRLADLAWQSATDVLVSQPLSRRTLLQALPVDGATVGATTPGARSLPGRVRAVVGMPSPARRYAWIGRTLVDLTGQAEDVTLPSGTTDVAPVG